MINNTTPKNTNVSTGIKTESEIYLKKSELPKNIGSFKNDVGYISQSTLNSWLKNHNYITKNGRKRYTAEILYRFITNNIDFEESHTGLEDVLIEKEILAECLKRGVKDGKMW